MEIQRQLLEELDVLEWAITQRFKRNPYLAEVIGLAKTDEVFKSTPKRAHTETLTQQHEVKFFVKQHAIARKRANDGFKTNSIALDVEKFKDPEQRYEYLLNAIDDIEADKSAEASTNAVHIMQQYALYSSAPAEESALRRKKRKYFLSTASAHLTQEVDRMFAASEMYGKYIDLTVFYNMYQELGGPKCSYAEYLRTFQRFEHISSSRESFKYLEMLHSYLELFFNHVHPFQNLVYPTLDVPASQKSDVEDGVANSNGEVYCQACNKLFAKKTVYDGHIGGKKHKKNVSSLKTLKGSVALTPTKPAPQLVLQHKISHICSLLAEIIENTANDHNRRAGFSDRERMLEVIGVQGEESDYTVIDSDFAADLEDEEFDNDSLYAKDLPLGPDGIPIPLWLYKLQGLHRSHNCEICGNVTYKGRVQFNKHFSLAKHVHGLTCLGVSEDSIPLFANISTISEAEELWKKIKRNRKQMVDFEQDTIEVEDEDGNIMSQKDYMELKKQGLI